MVNWQFKKNQHDFYLGLISIQLIIRMYTQKAHLQKAEYFESIFDES